jgi:hypothetical protein
LVDLAASANLAVDEQPSLDVARPPASPQPTEREGAVEHVGRHDRLRVVVGHGQVDDLQRGAEPVDRVKHTNAIRSGFHLVPKANRQLGVGVKLTGLAGA